MHVFATHFNRRYLARAVALARSLHTACPDARLCAVCLDDASSAAMGKLGLPGVLAVPPGEFESPALLALKRERTVAEYCWTCTPHAAEFALKTFPDADSATYLDADLYFFAAPDPIFGEMGDASVLITPHNFAQNAGKSERKNGKYNVQYITFRRDERGLRVLRWWRERCDEWCYDRHEDGRYGDQKYLDDWPTRFEGVHALKNTRLCLAPWNLPAHRVETSGGRVLVDGACALVFYHFQSLRVHSPDRFTLAIDYRLRPEDVEALYLPYVSALRLALKDLAEAGVDVSHEYAPMEPDTLLNRLRIFKRRLLGKHNLLELG